MVLFARTRFLISKYIDSSIALFSVHVMTLKEPAVNVIVGIVIVDAVASNNDAPAADDNHVSGSTTRAMKKLQHSR